MTLNRRAGMLFGAIYMLVGAVGFAVTSGVGFAATQGKDLILFELNPLHNLVHLAIGAALFFAARAGEEPSRTVNLLVGATYAAVGLAGFALVGTDANIIALNQPDNLLHLASAGVLLVAAMQSRRVTASAGR